MVGGKGDYVFVFVVEDLYLLFLVPSLSGVPDSYPLAGAVAGIQ